MSESYHIIQQPPLFPSTKVCSKCKQAKPIDDFNNDKYRLDGKRSACKVCRISEHAAHWQKMRKDRREGHRRTYYKKSLSFTNKDYERVFAQQGGVCAICKHPEIVRRQGGKVLRLAVDHNHKTGKVRGLLCRRCNINLALLEDEEFFFPAMAYLARYQ